MVTEVPTGAEGGARLVIPGVSSTVKLDPLLGTPLTVTTTFPVVAPAGTAAVIEAALQFVMAVAAMPLKLTVLPPWLAPKSVPMIVTAVPTGPEFGDRPVMPGVGRTVKLIPLLAKPLTVTTTFPVVAPAGTGALIEVALQLVGVDAMPLKVTVLDPWVDPKFVPAIVTEVPTAPDVGKRLVTVGGTRTVNATPLLADPPTVTTIFPEVAPAGTGT